jgi:prepilin-type N-terminal cleavage/methylation domain-containing protein
MNKPRARGFTLIELLTVIAIIAILVSITAAVAPRVLEKARITKTETNFKQIATAMASYQADNASLPLAYGYRWNPDIYYGFPKPGNGNPTFTALETWNLVPYMSMIGLFGERGLYDDYWTSSYDVAPGSNGNNHIDVMEFQPVGKLLPSGQYTFFKGSLYIGDNPNAVIFPGGDDFQRMGAQSRPYFYFPVNKEQVSVYKQYCDPSQRGTPRREGLIWDVNDPLLSQIQFPPATLDGYVLISPGPGNDLGGIVLPDGNSGDIAGTATMNGILTQLPQNATINGRLVNMKQDIYYVLALRAYYLATRDDNANEKLDNDYRARTRQGESEQTLPNGTLGYGPLIFVGG